MTQDVSPAPFDVDLTGEGGNTAIEYMFRDSGNWKNYETVVFSGRITGEQIRTIAARLIDGEYFRASQAEVPNLDFDGEQGFDACHELCSIRYTKRGTDEEPVSKFVDRLTS